MCHTIVISEDPGEAKVAKYGSGTSEKDRPQVFLKSI